MCDEVVSEKQIQQQHVQRTYTILMLTNAFGGRAQSATKHSIKGAQRAQDVCVRMWLGLQMHFKKEEKKLGNERTE